MANIEHFSGMAWSYDLNLHQRLNAEEAFFRREIEDFYV